MDCRRAEQLLPLHAGGDLAEGRERAALVAHLEGCAACRRAAEEWAEELRLLREDAPPEFDAAFFDSIRRDVMREIRADGPARHGFSLALLARTLRPAPLAFAASLALVCALALFFALRVARAPQPAQMTKGEGVSATLNKQLLSGNVEKKRTTGNASAQQRSRVESNAPTLTAHKRRPAPSPSPQSRETANAATPRDDGGGSSATVALVESPSAVAIPTLELPDASTQLALVKDEREMLKIDLRTGDPDVRIIWFSPQSGQQASPRTVNDKR